MKIAITILIIIAVSACLSTRPAGPENKIGETNSANSTDESEVTNFELCTIDEETYFSCRTEKRKTIALCGKERSGIVSSLSYRFGKADSVEIDYHWDADLEPNQRFFKNKYFRSAVEYNEVGFVNNGFEYRVYRHYDATENSKFSRGVYVNDADSGNEIGSFSCAEMVEDNLNILIEQLECDRDNALGCSD